MRTDPLRATIDLYCTLTAVLPGTKRLYVIMCGHLEAFLERQALVSDLNDLTFARFVEWRARRVANETLRGDCHKLLALWRWCAGGQRRWIEPPEVKAPQPQWRLPRALDREQLARLWATSRVYPGLVGTLPGNVVLTALLYVLWDTSERIGAVHQIERDNIDLARGWILLDPSARKGGRQGRLYKIRPATVAALRRLLEIYPGERPFAECRVNNLYKHWLRLRTEAGLPRWATFHTIRKSHASHLTALGGDARASLGHSSEAVTDRSYRDPRITATGRQPCEILFDPGRAWWQRLFRRRGTG